MGDFIRSLLRDTSSHHRPWQLSAALALGVMCGLLPKFSLMFCLIGGFCCAAPIHLPLAALTCMVSSVASTTLAATAGRVGLWSLTHPDLMELWFKLNALPWVSWLGLNNSVVHGSLLLGLALLIPVFALTKPVANRFAPQRRLLGTAPVDADFEHQLKPLVARADPSARASLAIETKMAHCAVESLAIETGATWPDEEDQPDVDEQTCQELEDLLATCNRDDARGLSSGEVVQRAAQMAHFVDDLLTSCQLESTSPASKPSRRDAPCDRHGAHLQVKPSLPRGNSDTIRDHADSSHGQRFGATPTVQRPVGEVHQAETLRYLLHHLKAIKDKVSIDADQ
ncbi:MAG: DUF2062 domain-containing protein [Pirellulaceae bacterium]|nr:DUF2062 domain-containing protein [Pirellulaceae bacterium]